jgi:acyl dehydratase
MLMTLYLEDLNPGMTVTAGPITLTEEDIVSFAKQYDPQPFHTDPIAAKNSFFNGLAGSGWHIAALAMRMLTQSRLADIANGLIGIEIRNLRWPRPTRPGDTLEMTVEILDTRTSKTRPGWGTATARWTMRNQEGNIVMELENVMWVARAPPRS